MNHPSLIEALICGVCTVGWFWGWLRYPKIMFAIFATVMCLDLG